MDGCRVSCLATATRLAYRGQLLACRVCFEVGERVVRVEPPYQLVAMPFGHRVHRVVATSAWSIATGRGYGYWAVTTGRATPVARRLPWSS